MSAYATIKTKFKDQKTLLKALEEMGYKTVETHETKQALVGYSHEKTMYANVIVRSANSNGTASKDFGFLKNADGTYTAMVNDMDQRSGRIDSNWHTNFANKYAETAFRAKAKQLGLRQGITKKVGNKLIMEYIQL